MRNDSASVLDSGALPDEGLLAQRIEILHGLRRLPKKLSPKFFYDQRGSELFDQICELPEYYVTRTELKIMRAHLPRLQNDLGPAQPSSSLVPALL